MTPQFLKEKDEQIKHLKDVNEDLRKELSTFPSRREEKRLYDILRMVDDQVFLLKQRIKKLETDLDFHLRLHK